MKHGESEFSSFTHTFPETQRPFSLSLSHTQTWTHTDVDFIVEAT